MLKNLSITAKFALIVGVALLGILCEMLISWHGEVTLSRLNSIQNSKDQITISILTLRRHEKNFLLRSDLQSNEDWKKEAQHLNDLIAGLDATSRDAGISAGPAAAALTSAAADYGKSFSALVQLQIKAGLTPESGLQGKLRNAVHDAEKSLAQLGDDHLTVLMLMLRRHEKDFLLRQDQTYVAKFEDGFKAIQSANIEPKVADEMAIYHSAFLEMVEARKAIGLAPDQGMTGQMRQAIRRTDESLNSLSTLLNDAIADTQTDLHRLSLALGLAISLIAFLLSVSIAREVVRPIGRLTTSTNLLAEGRTDIQIADTDRRDEIAPLAQALEHWRSALVENERRLRQEQDAQKEAQARHSRIEAATHNFETTIVSMLNKIGSTVEHLHRSANNLSANAEQTQRQSQAVSVATDQATANVETVSAASTELSASINEIARQVSQSAETSRSATQEASEANARILGLQDSAQKIGEVVNLINDIASQTNLLALNATIESARAGEAGKGFAVVANEVKHLAGQTGRATDDIAQQVSSVQSETQSTVAAIENIASTISRIAELSTAIASAVEEQGAATAEIAKSVEQASQGTREVAANISGVARTAAETGQMAQQVFQSANDLKQESHTLEQAVHSFLEEVRRA